MQTTSAAGMSNDERLKRDEAAVLRDFWGKFRKFAAHIPFAEDLLTVYYCAFDRATPSHVRLSMLGALIYFISPFDILPDLLPLIGFTDDAAVIAAVMRILWGNLKPEHREQARETLERIRQEQGA